MGYFFGILWCVAFGGMGFFLIRERRKHAHYTSFPAEVKAVATIRGRNTAILDSGIEDIGEMRIVFQDPGEYPEGLRVQCMWDGRDPATAQEDLRENQRLGIRICFGAVALMVVIMLVGTTVL